MTQNADVCHVYIHLNILLLATTEQNQLMTIFSSVMLLSVFVVSFLLPHCMYITTNNVTTESGICSGICTHDIYDMVHTSDLGAKLNTSELSNLFKKYSYLNCSFIHVNSLWLHDYSSK